MSLFRSLWGWPRASHARSAAPSDDVIGEGLGKGSDDAANPLTDAAATVRKDATAAASAEIEARRQRAAERLLEDESLRGDLTDNEFLPLLDWALAATDRLVSRTSGQDDGQAEETIERGDAHVREAVRVAGEAIAAVSQGDMAARGRALRDLPAALGDQWNPERGEQTARERLESAVEILTDDDSLGSVDLAHALAHALSDATTDTNESKLDAITTADMDACDAKPAPDPVVRCIL